jgi:hypothetical protein
VIAALRALEESDIANAGDELRWIVDLVAGARIGCGGLRAMISLAAIAEVRCVS